MIEKGNDDFQVFWNIPSFQCRPHKIFFTNITEKYNIIQNANDSFRGEKIAILYDPGNFPAILENIQTKELFLRNGGVPQEGNLTLHFLLFEEVVNQLIPDKNFNGKFMSFYFYPLCISIYEAFFILIASTVSI